MTLIISLDGMGNDDERDDDDNLKQLDAYQELVHLALTTILKVQVLLLFPFHKRRK